MALHSSMTGTDLHFTKVRTGAGSPNGVVTSSIAGEVYYDTTNDVFYFATSNDNSHWIAQPANPITPQLVARVAAIPLNATGQTTLFTVPTAKFFTPLQALVSIDSVTGFTSVGNMSIGVASAYTELVALTTLTGLSTAGLMLDLLATSSLQKWQRFTAAQVLKANVGTAAVSTTLLATVRLIGILENS